MVDGWVSLMSLLASIFVMGSEKDWHIWELDPHGIFYVNSFCKKLLKTSPYVHPKVWVGVSLFKVKVFG